MKLIIGIFLSVTLSFLSFAGAAKFDFKDPSGVSNLKFELKAPLEAIDGSASGISGSIDFDPSNPGMTNGTIVVDTSSLMVAKKKMRDHTMSSMWNECEEVP